LVRLRFSCLGSIFINRRCCFFVFKGLTLKQFLACNSIAEWSLTADFASTKEHFINFLIQTELDGCEFRASVRSVTVRLGLTHATAAPEVVLSAVDRVFYLETQKQLEKLLTILTTYGPTFSTTGKGVSSSWRPRFMFLDSNLSIVTWSCPTRSG
jgi:hypothetical protein